MSWAPPDDVFLKRTSEPKPSVQLLKLHRRSFGQLGDCTQGFLHNSPEVVTFAPNVTPTAIAAGGLQSPSRGEDASTRT